MRIKVLLAASVAVLIASQTASAFEKQTLGAQPSAKHAIPQPAIKPDTPFLERTDPAAPDGDSGTAITIPGLGTVGVLPKMDFGMELLYGAEPNQKLELSPQQDGDDLQIRGTLKHRF